MIVIERTVDLSRPVQAETLRGSGFTEEYNAHQFIIHATNNGVATPLSGTVQARWLNAAGESGYWDGEIVGGAAVFTLPQDCYEVPGRFYLTAYILTGEGASDGTSTVIYAAMGSITDATGSDQGQISGHIYTQGEIEAIIAAADSAVRYSSQSLTDAQKAQARLNIGAAGADSVAFDHAITTWSGSDNGVTISRGIDGTITFSGTHTGSYKFVSLTAGSLVKSSSTTVGSLPETAYTLELPADMVYRMTLRVVSGTWPSGKTLAIYDEDGNSIASLAAAIAGGVATVDFMAPAGKKLALVCQLQSVAYNVAFQVTMEAVGQAPQDLLQRRYDNFLPYKGHWKYGYFDTTGAIKNTTNTIEIYDSAYYNVEPGQLLYIATFTPTAEASRTQQFMIGTYYEGAWVSRVGGDPTLTVERNGIKVESYATRIPDTVDQVRVSVRNLSDSMTVMGYLFGAGTVLSKLTRPVVFAENAADYTKWLSERVGATENRIKPYNGVRSINHRGWSSCPENTLPAYKASAEHDFRIVETDIRCTSDNVPVLLHDASINRTARNADGTSISGTVNIADITYEQSQTYDFGVYKSSTYAGTKIPTLTEFLTLCRNLGLQAYCEIEAGQTAAQHRLIARTAIACGMEREVTWISSDDAALRNVMGVIPDGRFGLIPWTYSAAHLATAKGLLNGRAEVFLDMDKSQVTAEIVAACAAERIPIEIWVTDTEANITGANAYVSGFTSNSLIAADILKASVE